MLRIIQNDPQVPPGNIMENLSQLGMPFALHHPYREEPLPSPADTAAVIVLGGAMGANDEQQHPFLKSLKTFIREIVERQTPYLGICLGGQLLAAACGGSVASQRWEELGTLAVDLTIDGKTDRLFSGIEDSFTTFQWHHDSFDVPPGGTLLASSPACPHQAFRIGTHAWGTQFHPEVSEAIIRNWCSWDPATEPRSDELVADWQTAVDYHLTARQILENFLKTA